MLLTGLISRSRPRRALREGEPVCRSVTLLWNLSLLLQDERQPGVWYGASHDAGGTMLARLGALARRRPSLFCGAWFASFATAPALPLGTVGAGFVAIQALGGGAVRVPVGLTCASMGLPLVLALGLGALVGPRILRLPGARRARAAGWGAVVTGGTLLLWALSMEGLSRLSVGRAPGNVGGGGDVPGAAVVVGYLVVLPAIVLTVLLAGAVVGLLLHALAGHRSTDGMPAGASPADLSEDQPGSHAHGEQGAGDMSDREPDR